VISEADPYSHNLGFLNCSRYFFFSSSSSIVLMKAEWTPFETHFSENLVAPGIEPDLWICSQEL
jgi:hypothetical protein